VPSVAAAAPRATVDSHSRRPVVFAMLTIPVFQFAARKSGGQFGIRCHSVFFFSSGISEGIVFLAALVRVHHSDDNTCDGCSTSSGSAGDLEGMRSFQGSRMV
jgi:hypothetical protein